MTSRADRVIEWLAGRFDEPPQRPSLDETMEAVLLPLEQPLLLPEPQRSGLAEAALTIMAFSIVEGRVLDLGKSSGDVSRKTGRVEGDRTAGDRLCERVLAPRGIPATKGPFQSSTFRGGYDAGQARAGGLADFVAWHRGAALGDLQDATDHLIATFLTTAADLPDLPRLDASAMTFARFRSFLDELFVIPSGGAFEQYVFKVMLEQETEASGRRERVETKSVRSSDAATGSAGDVVVRRGGAVVAAFEITARDWKSKLGQLTTSARAGLTEVSIVAGDVDAKLQGSDLEAELASLQAELAVDVAVLDLMAVLDLYSSRITRFDRAHAIKSLYQHLVQWHRREPHLVAGLIDTLNSVGLTIADGLGPILDDEGSADDDDLRRARELADRLSETYDRDDLERALRLLG